MPGSDLYRILIIEDNATDVALIEEALSEHGIRYELEAIDDGQRAVDHLQHIESHSKPDLIILDLNLPRRDGLEILVRYRMHIPLADVPIVIVTSSNSPSDQQRAKTMGANDFIRKPMNLDDFLALGQRFRSFLPEAGVHCG